MAASDIHTKLAQHPHIWPALTVAASAGLLSGAWAFQIFEGLQPCPLCVYQRWPYWVMVTLGLTAALAGRRLQPSALALFAAVGGLVFLAGAGIAGFHVGVEQQWWEGLSTCGGVHTDSNLSIEKLKEKLFATPIARCDDMPWSLFGISLAGYNLISSVALALASAWVAHGIWRKTK
ncbi:MAG: disulfide bond formation protein B [Alphaproteobacteria bacterium]|nr:disulfide bond formation protein B [Alphaproteobacteria bacterium]HCP00290.1 disulfide bond formation protein B [Rhodospirillaceae bacterium]